MARDATKPRQLFEQDLIDQLQKGNVIAIVGAGVSISATDRNKLASWDGLLKHGINRCVDIKAADKRWAELQHDVLKLNDVDAWLSVAEQVQSKLERAREFQRWLNDTVGSLQATSTEVVGAIIGLRIPVITTNYDTLLEKVSGLSSVTWKQHDLVERVLKGEENGIFHIHGNYRFPDSVILGIRSYEDVRRDEHTQAVLRALLTMKTLLFIGFGKGLTDPNFGALIEWSKKALANSTYRHFRLALESECEEIAKEHDAADRIQVIPYGKKHEDLASFLSDLWSEVPTKRAAVPNDADPNVEPTEKPRPLGDVPEEYLQQLRETHGFIRFLELPATDEKDVPIDDLYVLPRLSAHPIDPDTSPESWPQTERLVDVLAKIPRLVLLADPGVGKTTLTSWITWKLAHPESRGYATTGLPGNTVPVPIVLRELRLTTDLTWEKLLDAFLAHRIGKHLRTRQHLEDLLRNHDVLVVLDGVDEVDNVNIRRKLRDAVHAAMSDYPKARWLLMSRPVGYDDVPFERRNHSEDPYLRRSYLAPFDDEQIEQFALKWYGHHETEKSTIRDKANGFVKAVHGKRDTQRLGRIAYLLTSMALIHRRNTRLPDGRNELYSHIAEAYLHSIAARRQLGIGIHSLEQKKRWLAKIGYLMQKRRAEQHKEKPASQDQDIILVARDELVSLLETSLRGEDVVVKAADEADRLLDHLARRSGLLVPRGVDKFAFMHLSLQEYFAAFFLFEECLKKRPFATRAYEYSEVNPPSEKELRQWANIPAWREVFILLFEMAAAIESQNGFLNYLFQKRFENPRDRTEGNAARLLAELSTNAGVALSKKSKTWARETCWSWELSAQHAVADELRDDAPQLIEEHQAMIQAPSAPSGSVVVAALIEEYQGDLGAAWRAANVNPDPKWTHLDLCGCTGVTQLSTLEGLSSLRNLNLSDCAGLSHLSLAKLSSLEYLNLSGCVRLTQLSSLDGLSALRNLNLSGCTGLTQLSSLDRLSALRNLNLSGCTGLSQISVAKLSSLEQLNLSGCTGLNQFSPSSSLWNLNLSRCTKLNGVSSLAGLSSLEYLNLSGCTELRELAPLAALSSLKYLDLSGCNRLSELTPVAELRSLCELNVTGCAGQATLPDELKQCENLRVLGLVD